MESTPKPNDTVEIDANGIIERFKKVLKCSTDTALAEAILTPQPTISSWKRRNSVPLEAIINVSLRTGSSLDFLIFGDDKYIGGNKTNFDIDILKLAVSFGLEFNSVYGKDQAKLASDITSFYQIISTRISFSENELKITREQAFDIERKWLEAFREAKVNPAAVGGENSKTSN